MIFYYVLLLLLTQPIKHNQVEVVKRQSAGSCSSTSNKLLYARAYNAEKRGVAGYYQLISPAVTRSRLD